MSTPTLTVLRDPDPTVGTAPGTGGVDIDETAEDYLAGLSAPTAEAYARDLNHLREYLAGCGLSVSDARRSDLARWVRRQEATGTRATTIRRRIAAAGGYYAHLVSTGVLGVSPADGLRRPRGGPAPRLGLPAADLARLHAVARAAGPTAELLVDLCLIQGLRVGEACAVDDHHVVSYGAQRALTVTRKGGRADIVGLVAEVADLVEAVASAQGPGPLLRGREGSRLSRQVAWRWVRRLADEAGIDDAVYPHLLRHSHITQALSGGTPLPVVQVGVGHADIRTTLGYAQALAGLGAESAEAVARRVSLA